MFRLPNGATLTLGDVSQQFGADDPVWGFYLELLASPPSDLDPEVLLQEFYDRVEVVAATANPWPDWMLREMERLRTPAP